MGLMVVKVHSANLPSLPRMHAVDDALADYDDNRSNILPFMHSLSGDQMWTRRTIEKTIVVADDGLRLWFTRAWRT